MLVSYHGRGSTEGYQEKVSDGKFEHMKSAKIALHKDGPIIKEESAKHNEKAATVTRSGCWFFSFNFVLNFMYESNHPGEYLSYS